MRRAAAALALLAALAGLGHVASTEIIGAGETRASDALPLYLSAAAVAEGMDPTQETSLARVYDDRDLSVGAATFSTLYPATTGAVLAPLAALSWAGFTELWRWTLLGAVALFGVAAAAMYPGDRAGRALRGGLVVAVLAWHPVTAECVRLGQVNLVLGALCATAMAGVAGIGTSNAARWFGSIVTGALLGLGGALKLVPGALLLPVLATRRWRPLVGAALIGLPALALALRVTAPEQLVSAIRGTLRFQASIDPDWLVGQKQAPGWMRVLGFIRHEPLQWISLGFAAIVPAARPSRDTAVAGMALLCAWLGADAAGFHVLYAPLAYPVLVLLSRDLRAFFAFSAVFGLLAAWPSGLGPEPRMVLFGLCAWVAAVAALLRSASRVAPGWLEGDGEARQAGLALAGVATGVLVAGAVPGEGPVAPPLPEGQTTPAGPGFIHANDRVPGQVRALGAGLGRPASTLARPGTIRALQLYMRRAPVAWRALAERYPARADLLAARADAAPGGDLRDHSGRDIAAWLREEQATITKLQAEGLELGDLSAGLDGALASGLTELGDDAGEE